LTILSDGARIIVRIILDAPAELLCEFKNEKAVNRAAAVRPAVQLLLREEGWEVDRINKAWLEIREGLD
jgi:hypothetical protein